MQSFFLAQQRAFLRYHDLPGENPVRVYLPGLGAAASVSFLNTAVHPLLLGNRSLLVDFLGSGFSDKPTHFSYSLEDHARTVAQLLDHLGLKDCDIIGHSLGGSIGITLAAMRPDLVARLVIAEGNLDPGGGSYSKQVAAQSEPDFINSGYQVSLEGILTAAIAGDTAMAALAGMFQVAAPLAIYRGAVSLVEGTHPPMRERFYRLPIPRIFIFGERSVPPDTASASPDAPDPEPLVERGIHVLVVPRAGHLMMSDNPTGFAEVIKQALTI